MDEDSIETTAWRAFYFGMRVSMQAYGIDEPSFKDNKAYQLLFEIAKGETTLGNPGESAARWPLLGDFAHIDKLVMESNRELTAKILKGYDNSMNVPDE